MIPNLFSARANVAIVLLGAALIIFGIKFTPYVLPAKYYFSFSTLVGRGSEPFIVDPPGIAAKKLCALFDKHAIPRDLFSRSIRCNEDTVDPGIAREPLSARELDKIYEIAIKLDATIRAMLLEAGKSLSVPPLHTLELEAILAKSPTPRVAYERISEHYAAAVGEKAEEAILPTLQILYGAVGHKDPETPDEGSEQSLAIPEHQRFKIRVAHEKYTLQQARLASSLRASAVSKTRIDAILQEYSGLDSVPTKIAHVYKTDIENGVKMRLRAAFEAEGVNFADEAGEQKLILKEVLFASYWNYGISILVRLLPVAMFALLAGFLFGRIEVLSISLAAALSAFLLSWPLMLMWDRLVQSSWAAKKPTFMLFYALYIASFYMTARAFAVLGARFAGPVPDSQAGSAEVVSLTWREVVVNVMGAVFLNALVYIWNIIIPYSAVGAN